VHLLGDPQGLILFAGEGLWPQLDALAQWADRVEHVRIIAAYGEDDDGGPAERLAAFAAQFLPDATARIEGPVPDDDPLATSRVIAEILANGGRWVAVGAGGTRLMFTGALLTRQSNPDLRLIHRDAHGPWYEIAVDGSARHLEGTEPRAVDRFTVEGLLDVTWSDEQRDARVVRAVAVEPEIRKAAEAVLRGADWSSEFHSACKVVLARSDRPYTDRGFLFERFIMSLIRGMGIADDDVALSAMLFDGKQPIQEVDVVVNSYGRLHVIDCKLVKPATAGAIGMQIRDAYATRRHLGDDADQYILLRPMLAFERPFLDLCHEYGIRVIDRDTLRTERLEHALRRLIRPPENPTDSVQAPRSLRLPVNQGVVDLQTEYVQSRERLRIYDLGHVIIAKLAPHNGMRHADVSAAVAAAIAGCGRVLNIGQNGTGNVFTVTVLPEKSCREQVRDQLIALGEGW
jgi:hypothetical protein